MNSEIIVIRYSTRVYNILYICIYTSVRATGHPIQRRPTSSSLLLAYYMTWGHRRRCCRLSVKHYCSDTHAHTHTYKLYGLLQKKYFDGINYARQRPCLSRGVHRTRKISRVRMYYIPIYTYIYTGCSTELHLPRVIGGNQILFFLFLWACLSKSNFVDNSVVNINLTFCEIRR